MEILLSVFTFDEPMFHRPDYPGKDKTLRRFEKFTLDHGGFQVKYNHHLNILPQIKTIYLVYQVVVYFGSVSLLFTTIASSTNA